MNEFPGLVDSHLHLLSLQERGLDPRACLREFFDAGGRWALDVAVDTAGWINRLALAGSEPRVLFSAGIHPAEAPAAGSEVWAALEAQVVHPRCAAVGEIGLDWYRGREAEAAQRDLFRRQVALASARGLPLVIHNRLADRELTEDLGAEGWSGRGILHCFSSDLTLARWALDRGFLLSFAGNLTYPASRGLREVAAWAPAEGLLVETDAPYLPPQGVRGQPNRPVQAGLTARVLAEVRGQTLAEVLAQTRHNFEVLFGLDPTGPE